MSPLFLTLLMVGCSSEDATVLTLPDCPPLEVFAPQEVDTNPILIEPSKVEAEYPEAALDALIEGQVVLSLIISAEGSVCSLVPVQVDPQGWGFETAAIDAVTQWRFEPAILDGDEVAVVFTVFVGFTLN